jgi:hypothetical protein
MFSTLGFGLNTRVGIATKDGEVGVLPLVVSLTHCSSLRTCKLVVNGYDVSIYLSKNTEALSVEN